MLLFVRPLPSFFFEFPTLNPVFKRISIFHTRNINKTVSNQYCFYDDVLIITSRFNFARENKTFPSSSSLHKRGYLDRGLS